VGLLASYAGFWRDERRARAFLAASLIDDLGIAVSAWASTLMMVNLAVTQRARAAIMLPTLACFLLGALVSGPLADWAARSPPAVLARWRWKVVLAGRGVETVVLAYLVTQLALGPPTIGRVLPFVMVSAFMKTALRATRIAFSVDLLRGTSPACDEKGVALRDERGAPLEYKTHLVTFTSLLSLVSTLAFLSGLLAGGRVLARVGDRSFLLFAFDVLTNVGFIALIYRFCKPAATQAGAAVLPAARAEGFWHSFAEGFRFLARPAQRPLLALLAGSWLVEVVTEAYDGKMVIKHVLHAGDDGVRYAEIVWTVVAAAGAALLPLIVRKVGSLGKIFLVTMLLDGIVIAASGRFAAAGAAAALVPFAAAICVDRSLTLTATTLSDVAQNSVSSAAMRGRIAGSYALVTIAGDMLSQLLATMAEERWGIPGLIVRAGVLQVVLVIIIATAGGRRLWSFGLRVQAPEPAGPELARERAA
jgi:hypothetical protein